MAHIIRSVLVIGNECLTVGVVSIASLKYFLTGLINGGGGPGAYYYPLMIQFIFVFPLIYFVVKKRNGLLICFLINLGYEIIKYAYGLNEECYRLLIFRYIFCIAFGAYIYGNKIEKVSRWIPLFVIGIVYIWAVSYTSFGLFFIEYWQGTSLFSALYIAPIVYLIVKSQRITRLRKPKLLCFFGKASYNIFLTQMVYYAIDDIIADFLNLTSWAHLIFNVFVCLLVGSVFFMIEQPITKKVITTYMKEHFETACQ